MSNSRAFASNQRPNKTTPSRRACASLPLSSPLYVPLASKFFVIFSSLPSPLFPRLAHPTPFLPTGLARVFHVDDQRRQRLRRLTLPRRALHRMLENVSSSPSYRPPLPPPLPLLTRFPCASATLFRVSHGAGWKSRERLAAAAMLTKYSRILPAIAGLSASMCIFT